MRGYPMEERPEQAVSDISSVQQEADMVQQCSQTVYLRWGLGTAVWAVHCTAARALNRTIIRVMQPLELCSAQPPWLNQWAWLRKAAESETCCSK